MCAETGFMNFYMCGFTCAFSHVDVFVWFYADFFVCLYFEAKTKATYFWCTYVQKRMNRCVRVWMMEKHLAFFMQWSMSAAHFSRWRCGCGYKMPAVALQDWCFWNPPSLCIPFQHKKTCPPAKVLLHCFHHHYFKRKQNCEPHSPRY